MKDKHGIEAKAGDTIKAVWKDSITGIQVGGYTGEIRENMTVNNIFPYSTYFHTLDPISVSFEFEIVNKTQ
jgi:hypothetical protein